MANSTYRRRSEIRKAWFDIQRSLFLIGAALYVAWHWVFMKLAPERAVDPLLERLWVAGILVFLWWLESVVDWFREKAPDFNLLVMIGLTLHYLTLMERNAYDSHHWLGLATMCIPILFAQVGYLQFFIYAGVIGGLLPLVGLRSGQDSTLFIAAWVTIVACGAYLLRMRIGAESQSMSARQEVETLLRQLPVGVIQQDTRGNVISFNQRAPEILDLSTQQLQGGLDLDILDAEGQLLPRTEYPSAVALREVREVSGRIVGLRSKETDEITWLQVNAAPLRTEDGQLLGTLSTFTDITLQRRMQNDLVQARALAAHASRLAAIGEMAGGIAHEINNPLAIVSGRIQQLETVLSELGWLNDSVIRILESVQGTTRRMTAIIHGLLTFARDRGDQAPFEKVAIAKVVEDVHNLCRERFKNHGVLLTIPTVPSEWVAECRPVQIGQILMNLLNNAHDAVWKPERLDPDAAVTLRIHPADDGFVFEVQDTGPGIPEPAAKRLFEPFFTTKAVGKGTGLGLSVSRSIAKSHTGTLQLASNYPCIFRLWIPSAQKSTSASQSA